MVAKCLLLLCLTLAQISMAQVYKITDLGTLGGNYSEALSINDFGHVVGDSCLDVACADVHPFYWTEATGIQDLGTLPNGNTYAIATGLNLLDQAVGSSAFTQPFAGSTHAFLWTGIEGLQDLGTLGCPDITGANGINLFGQVVGTSTIEPCPGGGQYRAFVWTQGEGMRDLATLSGGTFSLGNAINFFGQAVGYSDCLNCTGYHAFLWDIAGMQDLGTLPGGSFSAATGLNDFGSVVGNSDFAQSGGLADAFLWTHREGMSDLGMLPGGKWSSAAAINDFGEVVGGSDSATCVTHNFKWQRNGRATSNASHAFIWSAATGMRDLNDLIIPVRSGWLLTDAHAINQQGQIVGIGTINGQTHAFLLTPTGYRHRR
jgi:probable HAF family extracellular repeat protein